MNTPTAVNDPTAVNHPTALLSVLAGSLHLRQSFCSLPEGRPLTPQVYPPARGAGRSPIPVRPGPTTGWCCPPS